MTIVRVNGTDCETGCWVEGHWGQYGPDHLADKIDGVIDLEPEDDPRVYRQLAEEAEDALAGRREPVCAACGLETDYRRDRDRWVHVIRFPTTHIRVELDHTDCASLRPTWTVANLWEARHDAVDRIEQWLNENTPEGWLWHWRDGEFYLSPLCDDEENCTDEECAHWD